MIVSNDELWRFFSLSHIRESYLSTSSFRHCFHHISHDDSQCRGDVWGQHSEDNESNKTPDTGEKLSRQCLWVLITVPVQSKRYSLNDHTALMLSPQTRPTPVQVVHKMTVLEWNVLGGIERCLGTLKWLTNDVMIIVEETSHQRFNVNVDEKLIWSLQEDRLRKPASEDHQGTSRGSQITTKKL